MTTQRIIRNASVLWPIISTLLLGIADGIPNKFFCTSAECQSTWTPYKNMAAGLRGKCITIPSSIWGRWKKMTLTQFLLIASYYHGILAATFQTCKKVHIVMEVLSYTKPVAASSLRTSFHRGFFMHALPYYAIQIIVMLLVEFPLVTNISIYIFTKPVALFVNFSSSHIKLFSPL